LRDLDIKCKRKKHNPPNGFSGYRERFEKDERFRQRMHEMGRGIDFCDAYLNASWEEERKRREKGAKYAAARKAEWESWRSDSGAAIPQYGSTRTANQGRTWQHVGRVAAALAAASLVPEADAADGSITRYSRNKLALFLPAGASWTLFVVLVVVFFALLVIAYIMMRCRGKTMKNAETQTNESGSLAGDIFVSPAGECYHKATDCRGLKVARSYSQRRPCNVCVE